MNSQLVILPLQESQRLHQQDWLQSRFGYWGPDFVLGRFTGSKRISCSTVAWYYFITNAHGNTMKYGIIMRYRPCNFHHAMVLSQLTKTRIHNKCALPCHDFHPRVATLATRILWKAILHYAGSTWETIPWAWWVCHLMKHPARCQPLFAFQDCLDVLWVQSSQWPM